MSRRLLSKVIECSCSSEVWNTGKKGIAPPSNIDLVVLTNSPTANEVYTC